MPLKKSKLHIEYVAIGLLKPSEYNPRKISDRAMSDLKESIRRFGFADPLVANSAPGRKGILIGGHQRLKAAKELRYKEVPVIWLNIPDIEKEREINVRLNKNVGEFNWDLLADFGEEFLKDVGFSSEELDQIFDIDVTPEIFDLNRELAKLNIKKIRMQKGDVYKIGGSKLMVGDSTVEKDVLKLMGNEKTDLVITDPPYRLNYLKGKKRNGKATEGFGYKRDRKYLETDELPEDFTLRWMENVSRVANKDFSIICYENWKNLREVWNTMERFWKVRNLIIWHTPNRNQGFAAKHRLFSKHDIAVVGSTDKYNIPNFKPEEDELFENEYQSALYAITGKSQFESYGKGKKYCPTDHIDFNTADEKSSGQAIVFGVKPTEILIPYIKVLTKRRDLVFDPFGGSGSTGAASIKLGRRCNIMEKVPAYAEIIRNRLERLTNLKAIKL